MNYHGRFVIAAVVFVALQSSLPTMAYIPAAAPNGAPLKWPVVPINYKKQSVGALDLSGEFAAIDAAFTTWSGLANSSLSFNNQGLATTPPDPMDGQNVVAWIEDPTATVGAPAALFVTPELRAISRVRGNLAGDILEVDILLNGIHYAWTTSGSDSFTSRSGPLDVQHIVTHEIGHMVGLEHVTATQPTMSAIDYPGDTNFRTLTQDEISAVQSVYPSVVPPPDSTISGQVTRGGGGGVKRAVIVAFQAGVPVVETMTDATGTYTIRRVPAGSYLVRVQPYSRSTSVTETAFYQSSSNVDVDFLSMFYPNMVCQALQAGVRKPCASAADCTNPASACVPAGADEDLAAPVTVTAGANTPNINFTVSATGNQDDPFEQDDSFGTARAILPNGKVHLKHSWPSSDQDWVTFTATAGRLYLIETKNLGLKRDDSAGILDSATFIQLFDQTGGGTELASNFSPNDFEQNLGSRIARVETASATRYVKVIQRNFSNIGAGVYYDLSVRELVGPFGLPTVASVTPGEATVDGGVVVAVKGTLFLPGASVTFGGTPGTQADVQECVAPNDCRTIKVVVPAHAAGPVTVQVTNPDGGSGSLANGFTYNLKRIGTYVDGTSAAFLQNIGHGTVVCWGDFDNDGDQDLFCPYRNQGATQVGELWRNDGDGALTDITASAGLDTSPTLSRNSCAWGDYDGDGDLDLYVVYNGNGGTNRLYRNNGNATFTNIAATEGVVGNSPGKTDAAWADYDLDGDLDLYLAYGVSGTGNQLFRNNGGAGSPRFADVGVAAQVNTTGATSRVLWADYDRDGYPDLYVLKVSGQADILYHNNRNGTFADVTQVAGIVEGPNCGDAAWADFNNDKQIDLLCVGESLQGSQPQRFWLNQGNGTFVDQAPISGINSLGRSATSLAVLDKDNDGDIDAYLGCSNLFSFANENLDALLENNGGNPPAFTNVARQSPGSPAPESGVDETAFPRNANGTACADIDNDGNTDILVTGSNAFSDDDDYLWRGTSNTNQSITVRLEGTISNKWGIGAEVTTIGNLGATPTEQACLAASASTAAHRQEVIGGSHNQSSIDLEFWRGVPTDRSAPG